MQRGAGTSIPLAAAMEENNDMMLAFEMNGHRLPPDHGYRGSTLPILAFNVYSTTDRVRRVRWCACVRSQRYPVRVVLPGYVGGRMVKWLTKIEISDEESKNWHHYFGTHFQIIK